MNMTSQENTHPTASAAGPSSSETTLASDAIVVGSGMGGMTIASLLAADGFKVTVLEAAHVPGGCSSSFKRKGFVFESGATTLIGFDRHQPLKRLEDRLGISINRTEIDPGMTVHIDGERCIRYKDRERWIAEAARVFGNPDGQRKFWELAFRTADTVWRVSERNTHFPPQHLTDWLKLAVSNHPLDAFTLRHAFSSVSDVMERYRVDTRAFVKFIDEQLMITAQATASEVPFLFGAAGITYTNYSNFYVEGGLLGMIRQLQEFIESKGGTVITRRKVRQIVPQTRGGYLVETESGHLYSAPKVYSNLPVWNMAELTQGEVRGYFQKEAAKYDKAWGAFTMGVVTTDTYADELTLHHQIHTDEPMPFTGARSIFVSMSRRGDTARAADGFRAMNISTHTETEPWFTLNGSYDAVKEASEAWILQALRTHLPGFAGAEVQHSFSSTPVSWQNWVFRHKGRVGGIPQKMSRSLLDWSPAITPFDGLYLCGDTVYPGQGIPGVTLSGINVYYRTVHQAGAAPVKPTST
jgi:C-3',4' desaturase CrtD